MATSVRSTPSTCVARPTWPCTRAPKPPRNSRKFSTIAGSLSAILLAHWRTCKSAGRTRCRAITLRPRPPTRIFSPSGKTPTPTFRSTRKPRRNTPSCKRSRPEIAIDSFRRLAPLGDGPHHQRLPAPHVAAGEHAAHARHVVGVDCDIAARLKLDAELLDHAVLHRAGEAHGEQHQIGFQGEFGTRQRLHCRRHAHRMHLPDVAVFFAGDLHRVDAPIARAAFFVRAFDAQLHRPERP